MYLNLFSNCGTETCKHNSPCAFSFSILYKEYVRRYQVKLRVSVCPQVFVTMLSILRFQAVPVFDLPAAQSEAVMVGLGLELSAVSVACSCCSAWTASCLA